MVHQDPSERQPFLSEKSVLQIKAQTELVKANTEHLKAERQLTPKAPIEVMMNAAGVLLFAFVFLATVWMIFE